MSLHAIEPSAQDAAAARTYDLESQVYFREALDHVGCSGLPDAVVGAARKGAFKTIEYKCGVPTVRLSEFITVWEASLRPRVKSNGRSPHEITLPDGYVAVVAFLRKNVAPLAARGVLDTGSEARKKGKGGLGTVIRKALVFQEIAGARRLSESRTAPWIAPEATLTAWLKLHGYVS